ncbi:phage holin family protein [Paenibacillus agilis]|uniref:Phage holin family protein n=1 Tax=Paenibacillus agilis TaxID=3020863 RepID=A0A559IZK1_9BACL|nr:phage holin family protein [Paenibacillus agilis]TVX93058.1 phage holin family protein [Paenibacillus agilis]
MNQFTKLIAETIGFKTTEQVAATATVGAFGTMAAYMFGGWPTLLQVLLMMVIIDYVSGITAAGLTGTLRSGIGFIGIARKILIFLIVAIAHQVDLVLGDQHMIRDATIFFYMANELLSIIENAGRMGVPVPSVIRKAIEILKDKEGGKR